MSTQEYSISTIRSRPDIPSSPDLSSRNSPKRRPFFVPPDLAERGLNSVHPFPLVMDADKRPRGRRPAPIAYRVYPRVCGGTPSSAAAPPSAVYPRVCGGTPRWCDPRTWSIPACNDRRHGNEVYPRVCGGTAFGMPHSTPPHGLSPRVRGNRQDHCGYILRSIPACAGEPGEPARYRPSLVAD